MLLNDFYTYHDIVSHDNELNCHIVFNEKHDIFNGHFPGQPIVPGVCMMEIVKELLQIQVNKSLMLRSTRNVKFLQFVTPGMQPVAHISWEENEAGYMVSASFSEAGTILFKLDGTYSAMIF